ncbi:MAG: Ig-like domain-containing protein [Acidobacteria bacterium]|nr:Ig-like domain-containing protein [Acidobacteriota bacterium]
MLAVVTGTTQTSVTWSLSAPLGSISTTGLYTTQATVPTGYAVVVTARSMDDPTKFGTRTITVYPDLAITLAPRNANLSAAQKQQFTATVTGNTDTRVTWSLSGTNRGTISSAGLYTAPSTITSPQTVTVMARSLVNPLRTATATVNLIAPAPISVTINPATSILTPSQTQALAATVTGSTSTAAVNWSMSPAVGILVPNGTTAVYTAPSAVTAEQTVDIVARSAQDSTRFASTRITLKPQPVTISLTPASATLNASQTQALTATVTGSMNTNVTWSMSPAVGTISTSGNTAVYTAPSVLETPQTVEVVATSMAMSSATAKAILTLVPIISVTMTPPSAKLKAGQSQQFTATVAGTPNKGVTWSLSPTVGSVSATGIYTAPATIKTPQKVVVIATSAAIPLKTAEATAQLETSDLEFSLDENGLSTLSYQGTSFYAKPASGSNHILKGGIFRAPDGTETQIGWRTPSGASRSSGSDWVQHIYNANQPQQFTIRWDCAAVDARTFRVDTTIRNDDPTSTLAQINLTFAPLTLPSPIVGRTLHYGISINPTTADGLTVGLLKGTWGSVALWQQLPSSGTLGSYYNEINQLYFPFTLSNQTARSFESSAKQKVNEDPIPPRSSRTYSYFIRFGPAEATAQSLAPEAFDNYRAVFPSLLNWPDRRPIGNWFISEGSKRSRTNPRGYAWDPLLNVSDPATFRSTMLSQANGVISRMNAVNPRPQGLIVWDLEGQEFDHAFTYVGAPETLPAIAPEMDAIADDFFALFRNAGYRVGITLRPMKFGVGNIPPKDCRAESSNYPFSDKFIKLDAPYPLRGYVCSAPHTWTQANLYDQTRTDQDEELFNLLKKRISYAATRWGVTLFYIDSNIWGGGGPLAHTMFRALQQEFPNVLMIPEWENAQYYGATAPYNQANMDVLRTNDSIRELYPDAFSVINIADGRLEDVARRAAVVEGVKNGDILLYRAWWPAPEVSLMQSIYADAAVLKAASTPVK